MYKQQNGNRAALSVPISAIQRGADGAPLLWLVDPQTQAERGCGETGAVRRRPRAGAVGAARRRLGMIAGGHLLREGQLVAPVDRDNRPVLPAHRQALARASAE